MKKLFEDGSVVCDGKRLKANARLKPGARVTVNFPAPRPSEVLPEARDLEVLFEDEHLLVINKPADLTVHPSPTQLESTLVAALLHRGGALSQVGGPMRPGIVHRLDKDTSGLLVVAKTDRAHRGLAAEFADHGRSGSLERAYLALVWGAPPRPHGTIDAALGRHPASRTKMAVLKNKGRPAVTHYQVLATFGRDHGKGGPIASLLECRLETGRTHQVRVHLAHIGVPIIGDPLYGQGFKTKIGLLPEPLRDKLGSLHRQALHASRLGFAHPVTGTLLEFNSPLPRDLAEIVGSFKEL
jgi:23S rRNA pseudouridine1911/1915/1917 synthase